MLIGNLVIDQHNGDLVGYVVRDRLKDRRNKAKNKIISMAMQQGMYVKRVVSDRTNLPFVTEYIHLAKKDKK